MSEKKEDEVLFKEEKRMAALGEGEELPFLTIVAIKWAIGCANSAGLKGIPFSNIRVERIDKRMWIVCTETITESERAQRFYADDVKSSMSIKTS